MGAGPSREVRRYLARETDATEYRVSVAHGNDARTRLRTDLAAPTA
ncbi:hypothetical protein [Sphingomonas hengshuiensis]|nr:hypothetical protein [Sphingomonas hengshuiensis]